MIAHEKFTVGEVLLYETADGETRLDVKLQDETVWLTQLQMAELFQTTKQNISSHLKKIFTENELDKNSVVKEFFTTADDGKNYKTLNYNLDVILAVGYRVKSHRGTQFRIWANKRLQEFLIKGFTLDTKRLKQVEYTNYFEELMSRLRDIRSSEKVFWRKVLDIYATSIDYCPNAALTQHFFRAIQSKLHQVAHGKYASEVICARADSLKPNMGLTDWGGYLPLRNDIESAKNYLNEAELEKFNEAVILFLDFAEMNAKQRRPMYMQDWLKKIDELFTMSKHDIDEEFNNISYQYAVDKARCEYEKHHRIRMNERSTIEKHFMEILQTVNELEKVLNQPGREKKTLVHSHE